MSLINWLVEMVVRFMFFLWFLLHDTCSVDEANNMWGLHQGVTLDESGGVDEEAQRKLEEVRNLY